MISVKSHDITILLKEVVGSIKSEICVKSVVDNLNGTFTINTCDTKWMSKGYVFSIGENNYVVESFIQDKSIVIRGSVIIEECFTLSPPFFIVGTPSLTSTQLDQMKSNINRMPFIWLLETFSTNYDGDESNNIGALSNVRLFFMNCSNYNNWLNDDHRVNVVQPMSSLVDEFLKFCEKSSFFDDITQFSRVDRIKFGNYESNKGHMKSILPESLSGIEMSVNFPIFRQNNCKSNC